MIPSFLKYSVPKSSSSLSEIENRPASGKKFQDAFAAATEKINQTIEADKDRTSEVLRSVEENYANFVKSQVTYHEYLMKSAEQNGEMQQYMHHKVMLETYQVTLANLRLSNRYATV